MLLAGWPNNWKQNLTRSIDRWLVPPKPKAKRKSLFRSFASLRPYQFTTPYAKNNYVYLAFIGTFIFVNAALVISRLCEYKHSNGYVMLARACGKEILVFHRYSFLQIICVFIKRLTLLQEDWRLKETISLWLIPLWSFIGNLISIKGNVELIYISF